MHIVSHQLRTPLTTLRGLLEFWKSGEFKLFPEDKQKEMQDRIFISAERLNELIHDMLTAMDLEGGAFHFTFERINLIQLINEAYEILKDDFAKKQLEFRFNTGAFPEGLWLMADSRYLRQAFSNLLDNAQKYTEHGFVQVTLEKQHSSVMIRIQDSGIGLNEKDKERLFNKFSRGDRAESMLPNGSGLGLYIVKQIIQGHQGSTDAASEGENKGTTVRVTLPIIQ